MHHFNETETHWTDRGSWAFYLNFYENFCANKIYIFRIFVLIISCFLRVLCYFQHIQKKKTRFSFQCPWVEGREGRSRVTELLCSNMGVPKKNIIRTNISQFLKFIVQYNQLPIKWSLKFSSYFLWEPLHRQDGASFIQSLYQVIYGNL